MPYCATCKNAEADHFTNQCPHAIVGHPVPKIKPKLEAPPKTKSTSPGLTLSSIKQWLADHHPDLRIVGKTDRAKYMREYMKKRRAEK